MAIWDISSDMRDYSVPVDGIFLFVDMDFRGLGALELEGRTNDGAYTGVLCICRIGWIEVISCTRWA